MFRDSYFILYDRNRRTLAQHISELQKVMYLYSYVPK